MTLRQKLLVTFCGLGLMTLIVAGVTLWSMITWQKTNTMLEEHYQRSLLLQEIRGHVFRATKEVTDAFGGDDDAADEIGQAIAPVALALERWGALAHTVEEIHQVEQVNSAYVQIVADSEHIFHLLRQNQSEDGMDYMEEELEKQSLHVFDDLTAQVAASDRAYRKKVQQQVRWARRTDFMLLIIASFGAIALMFLLFAFLTSDLFRPLRRIQDALKAVGRGEYQARLPEQRHDEIGEVHCAFNRMAEAVAQRQNMNELAARPDTESTWQDTPSRLTLHRMLAQLRNQIKRLPGNGARAFSQDTIEEATQGLEALLDAVTRFAEFGFPLDLNLARFDVRSVLYESLLRFHEPFAARGVGFEVMVAPPVKTIVADRLKLREILGELIRNALAALPEQGGQIGLRATQTGEAVEIEVADDGHGADPHLLRQASEVDPSQDEPPTVGLAMVRLIVEQHGGHFDITSTPGQGTYVRLSFPLA